MLIVFPLFPIDFGLGRRAPEHFVQFVSKAVNPATAAHSLHLTAFRQSDELAGHMAL
jgi:hypothetical protein